MVGKANKCEMPKCLYPRKNSHGKIMLIPKGYNLSTKSGQYLRDINDIWMLCISCHQKYDRENIPGAAKSLRYEGKRVVANFKKR